jgi:hypothetical protein
MSWCSDAPEDEAISLSAGLLPNPDVPLNLHRFSQRNRRPPPCSRMYTGASVLTTVNCVGVLDSWLTDGVILEVSQVLLHLVSSIWHDIRGCVAQWPVWCVSRRQCTLKFIPKAPDDRASTRTTREFRCDWVDNTQISHSNFCNVTNVSDFMQCREVLTDHHDIVSGSRFSGPQADQRMLLLPTTVSRPHS